MTMDHPARASLPAHPRAAIDLLRGDDSPHAHWLRAVASACLGDALRAQVALRRAELPPEALTDVALPFADAVLADAPIAAWLVVAAAVHDAVGDVPPASPAHLAWELLVRATDTTADDSPQRALHVLTLGALARRLGRVDEARQLLRTAQEIARRREAPELLAASTRALVTLARADGDHELAGELLSWGRRQLGPRASLLADDEA